MRQPERMISDEIESDKFARLADMIEADPEWFQDDAIDDADLIEACRIAADALRRIGK